MLMDIILESKKIKERYIFAILKITYFWTTMKNGTYSNVNQWTFNIDREILNGTDLYPLNRHGYIELRQQANAIH